MRKLFAPAAIAFCSVVNAAAQGYPAKPIHFLVPFTPGSGTRPLAQPGALR